jgi:hypothetical protein
VNSFVDVRIFALCKSQVNVLRAPIKEDGGTGTAQFATTVTEFDERCTAPSRFDFSDLTSSGTSILMTVEYDKP